MKCIEIKKGMDTRDGFAHMGIEGETDLAERITDRMDAMGWSCVVQEEGDKEDTQCYIYGVRRNEVLKFKADYKTAKAECK